MSSIFLRQGSELVELVEQPYEAEHLLQALIADHSHLLAGDVPAAERHRWLLVSRELGVASEEGDTDRWSVDHLSLDQSGIPTLVEVKRSSDTRARRAVVGQMLDYAANAVVSWRLDRIREAFALRSDAEAALDEFLGVTGDREAFWESVRVNLQAGRLRLVFVSDSIPPELQRIVEFLNEQMASTEVLAIEVRQFVGGGQQTLVPRIVGQTEAARRTKVESRAESWQLDDVLAALDPLDAAVAADIHTWAKERGLRIWFGKGRIDRTFIPVDDSGGGFSPFSVSTWKGGTIEVLFEYMLKRPQRPFDDEAMRHDLQRRLNSLPGIALPDDRIAKRPNFPIALLRGPALQQFLSQIEWAIDQARAAHAPDE